MNLSAISVVYRKELKEWLRDRRTLISSLLVPLLLFPCSPPESAPRFPPW